MKKLFGFTPISAEKEDLSDSSDPQTQLQPVQRAVVYALRQLQRQRQHPLLSTPPRCHKQRGRPTAEEQRPEQRPEYLCHHPRNISW